MGKIKVQMNNIHFAVKNMLICVISVILIINYSVLAAVPGDDGSIQNVSLPDEYNVVNFNSVTDIIDSGAELSSLHTGENFYSALWNQNKNDTLIFSNVLKDWSSYDYLEMDVYAENAENTKFMFGPICYNKQGDTLNSSYFYKYDQEVHNGLNHYSFNLASDFKAARGASMDNIRDFRFTVGGWGMTVSDEARYYISSIKLVRVNQSKALKENYKLSELKTTTEALKNSKVVCVGYPIMLNNGETCNISEENPLASCEKNFNTVFVPTSFFSKYEKSDIKQDNDMCDITVDGTTAHIINSNRNFTVNEADFVFDAEPYIKDNIMYVPLSSLANAFGKNVAVGNNTIAVGENSDIDIFNSNGNLNDYCEIAEYLITYKKIDFSEETSEQLQNKYKDDLAAAKKAWRYLLVGDETNITDNDEIKKMYENIDERAKLAVERINDDPSKGIFKDITCIHTANMTAEYQRVYYMALAYGTFGCKLYNDEQLGNKIVYCLDWLYNNRYGEAEARNAGWRDTSLYNWWDWDIGTPQKLINTLMIMEKKLTPDQIKKYLYLFDKLEPTVESTGANRADIGTEIIGSGLLQGNVKKIIEARDDLLQIFLYSDNARNSGQGFYSDGSYIFHIAHPMNGAYGIDQLESVGLFLNVLHNTAFDYTVSALDNVPQWCFSSFEPLIYQGAVMRMVRGRNEPPSEHKAGLNVISCMLDLINAVNDENRERIKSIIKTQVTEDKSGINYYTSLPVVKSIMLRKIMSDENVDLRENYCLNKVYYNMDKVVHQRESFAVGISMSSSRVFGYESCNDQNKRGWYLGDGMTTVYTSNDFTQYSDDYWNHIDPYRLPGITADTQKREEVSISTGNEWLSSKSFVGGVSWEDVYGTAAMDLESYHNEQSDKETSSDYGSKAPSHSSSLTAKKSWFMFDDEIVALGCDINASDDANVLTIVDNCLSEKTELKSGNGNQVTPYVISGVEASQVPEQENSPENTLDGQFSTKWAADGIGDITWDLGAIKKCGYIKLSFMNGNIRQHDISIDISEDNLNWENKFRGMTGGTTEEAETYDLKNCSARYIKMTTYGSTSKTSNWTSLTTASIYPEYEMKIPEENRSTYMGVDYVRTDVGDMTKSIDISDVSLDKIRWINWGEKRGYYFPNAENLYARRTEGNSSFFELWFDHGINPINGCYEYAMLPSKNPQQTEEYSKNPDIEILSNTSAIQAVYEKKLGITSAVFREAGELGDIKTDCPMIVMLGEKNGKQVLCVSDPTHQLKSGNVTIAGRKNVAIDFSNSRGKTITAVLSD